MVYCFAEAVQGLDDSATTHGAVQKTQTAAIDIIFLSAIALNLSVLFFLLLPMPPESKEKTPTATDWLQELRKKFQADHKHLTVTGREQERKGPALALQVREVKTANSK